MDRDPVIEAWGRAEQHRLRATEILEHGGQPVELAAHLSAAASQFETAAEIIRQRAATGRGADAPERRSLKTKPQTEEG